MATFQLDLLNTRGEVTGPALDADCKPWEPCNHMSTARDRAMQSARMAEVDVQISRVLPEDKVMPSLIVKPDGTAARPLHTKPVSRHEDCTKGTGRACFCSPCRAERRENRS